MTDQTVDSYYNYRASNDGIDAKVVVMGNTGVGKTSLVTRYTENKFSPATTTSTTGAFFVTKKVYMGGFKVRLQIWDTAGQERFRSMAPMFYRGASAAILVYDITQESTFEDLKSWLEELKRNCPPDLIIYIVGSKADLAPHYRAITLDRARLNLHTWFPPPKPPSPPLTSTASATTPPTLSYIRPRFPTLPSSLSAPFGSPSAATASTTTTSSGSSGVVPGTSTPPPSRIGGHAAVSPKHHRREMSQPRSTQTGFAFPGTAGRRGWDEDSSTRGEDDEDEQEWGLKKGMEILEVSAKDDEGISDLFGALINAIIKRRDIIERERERRERDSVMLHDTGPAWGPVADAEEAAMRERERAAGWGSCC